MENWRKTFKMQMVFFAFVLLLIAIGSIAEIWLFREKIVSRMHENPTIGLFGLGSTVFAVGACLWASGLCLKIRRDTAKHERTLKELAQARASGDTEKVAEIQAEALRNLEEMRRRKSN